MRILIPVCLIAWGMGMGCNAERQTAAAPAAREATPQAKPVKTPVMPPVTTATMANAATPAAAPTQTPAAAPAGPRMSDKLTTEGIALHRGEPGVARLAWTTQSEDNSFGFYVMRAREAKGPFEPVNKAPLMGAGVSSTAQNYVYYDTSVKVGETYYYYIREVDLDGTSKDFSEFTSRLLVNRLNLDAATTGTAKK